MKLTLDLSKLLEEGKITREEHDKRWVVNTAAVFGSIHFYTQ